MPADPQLECDKLLPDPSVEYHVAESGAGLVGGFGAGGGAGVRGGACGGRFFFACFFACLFAFFFAFSALAFAAFAFAALAVDVLADFAAGAALASVAATSAMTPLPTSAIAVKVAIAGRVLHFDAAPDDLMRDPPSRSRCKDWNESPCPVKQASA